MRVLILFVALCTVLLAGAAPALADGTHAGDAHAVHFYVSLCDSLAESFQPNLDFSCLALPVQFRRPEQEE